ncbi:Uncharacterized conserved protein [Salegentibacter echinorum]|uniref:Uncharacterized conserved protein n=1 Tax=Salegentibacter echinorum TaxID=1073325 RepID=A0A1M5J908_SALEC|nr:esterase-like activity of phytase family protein [Salegentibacter echinorum]SHG36835.1 Uncharacterized conserved protein [Salegentibacter echinorum]
MKRIILLLLLSGSILSCATSRKIEQQEIKLSYLDDVVIPNDLEFDGIKVGGISGIDYHNGSYYLVCDQPSNPRFYKAEIPMINRSLDTVLITEMIKLDNEQDFIKNNTLDLEAIRFDAETNKIILTSEGSIKYGKDPVVFEVSPEGQFLADYKIPEYFRVSGEQKPRHNGVFEGLSESFDKKAYWVATELPLEKDGPKPKVFPTKSMVRITKFNKKTKEAERQFAYKLDGISKLPINWFAVNGVTDILEYAEDKFLILERAYSAGYGSNGNTVKIFQVDASKASNTLAIDNLKKSDYQKASKKLVFDFKSIKSFLTKEIIDNIEGMTFGPDLPNGKKSLILVSDDNFSSFSKQINQFILLELEIK